MKDHGTEVKSRAVAGPWRPALVAALLVALGALALLVAGGLAAPADAQSEPAWELRCPLMPSYLKVGTASSPLAARVFPDSAAADIDFTWTIEHIGDGSTEVQTGRAVTLEYAAPSGAEAQTVWLSATDSSGATVSGYCRGVVAVEQSAIVIAPDAAATAKQQIEAAGNNAVIYLDRGTHRNVFNVKPRDGQTISGFVASNGKRPLTILDGGLRDSFRTRTAAFLVNPTDRFSQGVVLQNMKLTRYRTWTDENGLKDSGHHGVIHVQTATSTRLANCSAPDGQASNESEPRNPPGYGAAVDWKLRNLDISGNLGAGVILSSGVQVLDSVIADNAHIGIGGAFIDFAVIDNVEVRGNGKNNPDIVQNNHSGGLKITRSTNLHILNSTFDDNFGPGIWLDIYTWGVRVINNVTTNNSFHGIFQEISWASEIRNNTSVANDGFDLFVAETGGYRLSNTPDEVRNVVEHNKLGDADVQIREFANGRPCDFEKFWEADSTIVPPDADIAGPEDPGFEGFVVQLNDFNSNGPTAAGAVADPVAEVAQWMPRVVSPAAVPGASAALATPPRVSASLRSPVAPVRPVSCEARAVGTSVTVDWVPAAGDNAAAYLLYRAPAGTSLDEGVWRAGWTESVGVGARQL